MRSIVAFISTIAMLVGISVVAPAPAFAGDGDTPVNPATPTPIYTEDFENVSGSTPTALSGYDSASNGSDGKPITYTASSYWQDTKYCNGFIASGGMVLSQSDVFNTYCGKNGDPTGNNMGDYDAVRAKAYALANVSDPNNGNMTNHALSTNTSGGQPPADPMFTTNGSPISVGTNRFIELAVDAAATGCNQATPELSFKMTGLPGGVNQSLTNGTINPCKLDNAKTFSVASKFTDTLPDWATTGAVGTYYSNAYLISGDSSKVNIGLELDNASKASSDGCGAYAVNGKCPAGTQSALTKNPPDGSGNGNDGAIDNIRVLDVSPYLTKSFNPTTVKVGDTSTLTLTVNNRTDNGTKNGWAFTDALPDGLVVANTPNVKADGNNGSCKADVTAAAGSSSIGIANGDLPGGSSAADPTTCTITVDVTPTKAGDLTNGSSNIESTVGMDGPQTPATLTAIEGPTAQDSSATTQPGVAVDLKPTTGFGTSQKFTSVAFDKSGATTKTVPGEGTWTITLGDDGQPVATFTPDADFTGKATTQPYIVTDENNLTATANLDVTVAAITGPTAKDKSATTKPSTPVTLNPETGFGTSQKFTSVAFDDKGATTKDVPGEGTWTIKLNDEGKPEAVFTPVDGFTGTATPQPYIVTDENGLTATANLDVTVLAPPTAKDKSATTNPKTPVTLDPETGFGTSQKFTGVAFDKSGATTKDVPGEGSWTISLNDKGQPEAVFTPVDGFTGAATPQPYIVTDENGLTATANLDVTVLAPPTASDKSATTDPGKAVTLDPETGFGTSQKFTGVAFDKSGATTKDVPGEGT
jgi:uncharacterized repeat protein (TIGR01451 family)